MNMLQMVLRSLGIGPDVIAQLETAIAKVSDPATLAMLEKLGGEFGSTVERLSRLERSVDAICRRLDCGPYDDIAIDAAGSMDRSGSALGSVVPAIASGGIASDGGNLVPFSQRRIGP